jgi:hypothetical protein
MRRKKRGFRLLAAGLVMAGSALAAGQSPAHAVGTGAVVVAGSGTISPGLTTVPTNQSFTFSTVASFAAVGSTNGGANVVTLNCFFSGSSTLPETTAAGLGTGSGSCTTSQSIVGSISITCSMTYLRVGPIQIIIYTCTITINGNSNNSGIEIGICVWAPTTFNPTTSYVTVCEWADLATNI